MKPVDVKSSTHIDFGIEYNDEYPKPEVADHVRTSKYKLIFVKELFGLKKFLWLKKLKVLCHGHYRRP